MSYHSRNPTLGESANIKDDRGEIELPNVGDDLIDTTFEAHRTERDAPTNLNQASNSSSVDAYGGSEDDLQDVATIINRELGNFFTQDYKFNVLKNSSNRSTTHKMKNDCLVAMPDKDIPIGVEGARGGHVVKVMLRYSAGPHYETPVRACKMHEHMNDPGYSFYVPILDAMRRVGPQGHLSIEVRVTHQDSGNFKFPVGFRCLNSCHKKWGKKQVMILQLCDIDDYLLKEERIELRVCKNVTRDSKVQDQEQNGRQAEKHPAEEPEEESPKRVKKEVESQPEEASTPAPCSLLLFDRDEESCLLHKNGLLNSQDGATRLTLEWDASSLAAAATSKLQPANIVIIPSTPKNPNYKNPSKVSKASTSSAKDSSTSLPSSKSCQMASSKASSPTSTKNEKPEDVVVVGLDEEKRDLVDRLVRMIGGTSYRIPHQVTLMEDMGAQFRSVEEGVGSAATGPLYGTL